MIIIFNDATCAYLARLNLELAVSSIYTYAHNRERGLRAESSSPQ